MLPRPDVHIVAAVPSADPIAAASPAYADPHVDAAVVVVVAASHHDVARTTAASWTPPRICDMGGLAVSQACLPFERV